MPRRAGRQAAVEGVLADAVVDHGHALAVGEPRAPRGAISVSVYRIISSAPASRASSSFAAVDTVPMTRPPSALIWDEQQPHATGRGVHEHVVARLHGIGRVAQVVRGHALQHRAGGTSRRYAVGHGSPRRLGHPGQLGVAADRAAPSATRSPTLEPADAVADGHAPRRRPPTRARRAAAAGRRRSADTCRCSSRRRPPPRASSSPAPGVGSATSAARSTSGPPGDSTCTARMGSPPELQDVFLSANQPARRVVPAPLGEPGPTAARRNRRSGRGTT